METKNILLIAIIAFVIIIGAALLYANQNSVTNATHVNNTTNVTGNNTLNTTGIGAKNASLNNSVGSSSASSSSSSQSNSDPAYGSDEYVRKWDQSQASNDDWSYTHDQPVKTGDDGQQYARVYDEDSGESSWRPMAPAENKNSE